MGAAYLRAPEAKPILVKRVSRSGKERYATPGLAQAVLNRSARNHTAEKCARKDEGVRLAYRCVFCGGWHIGPSHAKRINSAKARAELIVRET